MHDDEAEKFIENLWLCICFVLRRWQDMFALFMQVRERETEVNIVDDVSTLNIHTVSVLDLFQPST